MYPIHRGLKAVSNLIHAVRKCLGSRTVRRRVKLFNHEASNGQRLGSFLQKTLSVPVDPNHVPCRIQHSAASCCTDRAEVAAVFIFTAAQSTHAQLFLVTVPVPVTNINLLLWHDLLKKKEVRSFIFSRSRPGFKTVTTCSCKAVNRSDSAELVQFEIIHFLGATQHIS